jgi:hypothetical protein
MDNQQQQPSGRTQPGDGAPAHLSVEAARPIETMSREATAGRAILIDRVTSEELTDGTRYVYYWNNEQTAPVEIKIEGGLNR